MRPVRLGLLSGAAALLLSLCAGVLLPASAQAVSSLHPLGKFTANHYNGLRITPAEVRNLAVVDLAELPTLQAKPQVNAGYAARRCAALAAAQRLVVAGKAVPWQVASSEFAYAPGEGGLQTSRLTCRLVAAVRASGDVEFTDGFEQDRIGWREITAVGDGVRLSRSSVPAVSVSRELRAYPDDLLSDPLDQRTATLTASAVPGSGTMSDVPGSGTMSDVPGSGTMSDVPGSGTMSDVPGSGT
ncbi:hypothetical protein ACTWQA_45015, partial [Nonomuraea sp. 10N515B]